MLSRTTIFFLALTVCATSGCGDTSKGVDKGEPESQTRVLTGADVVSAADFALLRGKTVGLIANHTTTVGAEHLADLLHRSASVDLVALFGPEHGLRGTADAGATISDSVDSATGVPVYSLYGERRRPSPDILDSIEVLVFDIQDVGARFYTYISTMGLAMEAAVEADVEFVVLDRPNPLGGDYVSGFVRDADQQSFVGFYPVPVAHGLTVGELARMAVGERWIAGADRLKLTVVSMQGWSRSTQWADTGLPWVPPSPNIPDFETALVYPGACFVEATVASEGRGTEHPFVTIGAEWVDGEALAQRLNAASSPGVRFEAVRFTPRSIPGMSTNPKLLGKELGGVAYRITDRATFQPVETGVELLRALYGQFVKAHPKADKDAFFRTSGMNRLAGTGRLQSMITGGAATDVIVASWAKEVARFDDLRSGYLLYD